MTPQYCPTFCHFCQKTVSNVIKPSKISKIIKSHLHYTVVHNIVYFTTRISQDFYLKVIPRAQNTSTRCLFTYLDFFIRFFCLLRKKLQLKLDRRLHKLYTISYLFNEFVALLSVFILLFSLFCLFRKFRHLEIQGTREDI